jgi:uncharacterized protein (TIGR02646 family)
MRFIDKQVCVAPERVAGSLRNVRAASWNSWSGTQKKNVIRALASAQGYVCAYCESRLSADVEPRDEAAYHAEHIVPVKHPDGVARQFDWDNLVASCRKEFAVASPRHCGHGRGEWYDAACFIHPLQPHCEQAFVFNDLGEVLPAMGGAEETIARLNLNLERLVMRRREALNAFVLSLFLVDVPSDEELQQLRASLDVLSSAGEAVPYRSALAQSLDRLLQAA